MDERMQNPENLLAFPTDYVFKAFGPNDPDGEFQERVQRAVGQVVPVSLDALKTRPSREGTYVCVSVLVRLTSYAQLTGIYAVLRQVEGLKYLL